MVSLSEEALVTLLCSSAPSVLLLLYLAAVISQALSVTNSNTLSIAPHIIICGGLWQLYYECKQTDEQQRLNCMLYMFRMKEIKAEDEVHTTGNAV